jgi:2-polyprenyl-6-methoxyphenol hydroxylase-like FAD-dependent oxidoreductase
MSNWPENFIVLGDALCAFNPIYAHGMSVAAMEVMTLERSLRRYHSSPAEINGLARQVQRQMAKVIEIPWLMATLDDTRWPATEDGTPGLTRRFLHRYLNQIMALATKYPEVDQIFAEVAHLIKPPYVLLQPRIIYRVIKQLLRMKSVNN